MDAIVLHHILRPLDFHPVEENLRESFRALAEGRDAGDVLELGGVSIASLGVAFQMFNAAFLSSAVVDRQDFERRLAAASAHFRSRRMSWAFWICEDWLPPSVRRVAAQICQRFGLRAASEMPGMIAPRLPPAPVEPALEFRRTLCPRTLNDFRAIGAVCFHVPTAWFSEVFDERVLAPEHPFRCYVGYTGGVPVATCGSVTSEGAIGIYNVATAPGHRGRGYGEAMTRYAIASAQEAGRGDAAVLQSTAQGLRIYDRLGFRSVTRIVVYTSI